MRTIALLIVATSLTSIGYYWYGDVSSKQAESEANVPAQCLDTQITKYYAGSGIKRCESVPEGAYKVSESAWECNDGLFYLRGSQSCKPLPDGAYIKNYTEDWQLEKCKSGYYYEFLGRDHSFVCLKIPEHGFKVEDYEWECEYPYVKGVINDTNQLGCLIQPENSSIQRECEDCNYDPDDGSVYGCQCGAKYWECDFGYSEGIVDNEVACTVDKEEMEMLKRLEDERE